MELRTPPAATLCATTLSAATLRAATLLTGALCAAALVGVAAGCVPPPASAGALAPPASATVKLSASLSPERLGAQTAVSTSFRVTPPPGQAALPVARAQLLYPAGLGFGTSELGLQSCLRTQLEARGSRACPGNSLMGRGSAVVAVRFGARSVVETAPVSIFSQPVQEGHLGLLFSAAGRSPVIANLVFGGLVLDAGAPFGGSVDTDLPLVPAVPKGPYVTLSALATTIGGAITYRERIKGRIVAFHPRGMLLPHSCPRGGFPFAVRLTFSDGSSAAARAAVPCPRRRG
jgi:hypothetical protein